MRETGFNPSFDFKSPKASVDLTKENELSRRTVPGKGEFVKDLTENLTLAQELAPALKRIEKQKEVEKNPDLYMEEIYSKVFKVLDQLDQNNNEASASVTSIVNEFFSREFNKGRQEYVRKTVQKLLDEFSQQNKQPQVEFLKRQVKFFNL